MGKVQVKTGTPVDGEGLCMTCEHVHMQRGFRESEEVIFCTFGCYDQPRRVPFKVRECTQYRDKNVPSREYMEEIALLVEPRRRAGFQHGGDGVSPSEGTEPVVAAVKPHIAE